MLEQLEFTGDRVNERLLFFAFWLVSVAKIVSMMVVDDPDLWGKIIYGLEQLASGSLLRIDTYSYTAFGAPLTNHEWLSEVMFALGWKTAGSTGLWVIRIILVAVTLGIVLWLIYDTTRGIWAGLLVYATCWYEMARGFAIRPQLFTYLFFAILLFLVHRIYLKRSWNIWWVLAIAPLMSLWANLHGGFVVGLGLMSLLAIYITMEWLHGRTTQQRLLFTVLGLASSYAATLVNPYGVGLWTWLARSLSESRSDKITEWAPMYGFEPQSAVIGFYITVALMVILLVGIRAKRNPFEWGLLLTVCVLAWINNRHGVLFCTAAAVFLPRHIESLFPKLAAPRGFHKSFVVAAVVSCSVYAVGIHFLPGHRPTAMLVETSKQPYNAIKFIHDNGLRGNILVFFNWAQSAIYYLHDTCKVAFDGRFRAVYPKKVEDDYFHFNNLDNKWENLIDHYHTQMVLMPGNWPGVKLLARRHDWQVVYRSTVLEADFPSGRQCENAVLLIRRGAFPEFEGRLERGDIEQPQVREVIRFGEPLNGESSCSQTIDNSPRGLNTGASFLTVYL
jgi:hypothetical protein